MIYEIQQTENVAPLFAGWQETMIWSCLQKVMGHIYGNAELESAMALLGDFCFLAGKPARELVLFKPNHCVQDFVIMVPSEEAWMRLIEDCYGEKAKKVTRYAMKKEQGIFDRDKLQRAVCQLSGKNAASVGICGGEGQYTLKMMDKDLFHRCKKMEWCRDWVSQYPDYGTYQKYGLGAVILNGEEPVAGASSYSSYLGGIEIEIDTKEEFRRRGLAYICGAKLILECLDRGWYPSWDAQNKWSVALAEKLGYHFDHEYTAYEIWGY